MRLTCRLPKRLIAPLFAMAFWTSGTAASGAMEEYILPDGVSAPFSIAVDSAGRVWFAEKIGKALTVFDPEKGRFESHSLPADWGNIGPSVIAVGPRDRVWFSVRRWAESDADINVLGEFAPADGSFTRHVLEDPADYNGMRADHPAVVPEDLLVDRRGSVWFLAPDANRLYRYDPATRRLKGHPIPTIHGYPRGLSIAGDNVLWFVETNANQIAKFDPATQGFREYAIPTKFSSPAKSAVDTQGRVWFVEMATNRLGVFYPDRERFDEALIPTPRSLPGALAADDEGNIWFLEYRGNKVGVFNPQMATFREFDIPTYGSEPGDMAIDAKRGRLWFSEAGTEARRLGMLSLAEALAANEGAAEAPAAKNNTVFGSGVIAAISVVFLLLVAVGGRYIARLGKRPAK